MINLFYGILAGGVSYLLGSPLLWSLGTVVITIAVWSFWDWAIHGRW